ncbi:MAG: HAMP domain-containing sensor histidine kinase, partial [Sutterellaceae bacterium]|nr:HAMP domain-containing sensor histidine kinase [Sutterellaceae bacterium]
MKLFNKIKHTLLGATQNLSAHVLVEQITLSLRLHPVSVAGQFIGGLAICARFWHAINRPLLLCWMLVLVASIWAWEMYRRRFAADAHREADIRDWLRKWMINTVFTGLVWGFAGVAFLITQDAIDLIVLVSVIVAVVFASWPAYSCWIPSLTVVMFLSLAPMTLALAAAFDVGAVAMMSILIVLLGFVLYCGRRLNEIVVLAVTRDVQNERLVARLKSEKALAESQRRATALASERRAKFFAGANHDLRQPLQAMGIYLQILQMSATDANREVIGQLDATAKNISTLVEQLLEVSRIETGNVEIKTEDVRVDALFGELAGEFATVAASKGLVFVTRPLNVTIHTDPLLVSRILRNLITNAIRYTSKPGGKIVLAARKLKGNRITLCVYDEGPGIAPEERNRIFEAFYRGSAGKGTTEGFGLGLSIVQGLAHRLAIGLSVGSRVGRGSVFRLEFDSFKGETTTTNATGLPLILDLDMRGVVGVLEDNDIVRNAVSAILKSWGATVVAAREPNKEFVDRMIEEGQNGNLAALVSDYNLGDGMSTGLEVIFMV